MRIITDKSVFKHPAQSGGCFTGFNHGLRAILWRAFGMTNFTHFRLRVLDRFGSPRKS